MIAQHLLSLFDAEPVDHLVEIAKAQGAGNALSHPILGRPQTPRQVGALLFMRGPHM
ncbi:hypothetical protein [Asticcacaulis sp. AC402]|uniref:hypothetical protein n=1 Tax=Asticcacaulis sp. AC402 TaxID=1282361 RepID=UPI0003C3D28E|nr:hypothetical protein [Asticcacaulis sp. AC402]ESQ73777.1 hypothetical protein ABAC402_17490 [Asticcacaulis sp. AC402]